MTERIQTVAQGESIDTLAYREGLLPDTIWEHPSNSALHGSERSHHVLHPGDRVTIPARRVRYEACATEQRHRFVRKTRTARLHVRFLDGERPRANLPYTISIDDEPPIQATTDGDGYIDHVISPLAQLALVHFDADGDGEEFELYLGHLDPVSTPSGVQQRLRNLALYQGDEYADEWDDDLARAVSGFQRLHGLEETGQLDAPTRAALVQAHGS